MFGGVCFLLYGNMACGILKYDIIIRVGLEKYEESLKQPHARMFDFTVRPMIGWVMVSPEGHESDAELNNGCKKVLIMPCHYLLSDSVS